VSYYKLLGFSKEPFSTNPDPYFLYMSREYDLALTNILIQLRLKRGLSVVLGDVGTGKTSLSRKIVQELHKREDFIAHVVLNPIFEDEKEFLYYLTKNLQDADLPNLDQIRVSELRDRFEKFLFQKNTIENKTVILIIDEAQKLSMETLESLRILLNYETNDFKLIQIVMLGQLELFSEISQIQNFYDRIDFKFSLNPLGFKETKEMIEFRIRQAGYGKANYLFLDEAINEIYHYSKGYPRTIIRIAHKCLRSLIFNRSKTVVDRQVASEVIDKDSGNKWKKITIAQKKNF
jgi:general secretion pathway protein A